ncbi:putative esterase KAI2 [Apostasia shenzhenica]|uniref:Putative esterase KAI2 n=1 Tax=Apostasia shenzhenica TaxID=1088818 RepID=A0A2I0ANS5_9ASPA|nr:putative esterase KAI2 [Apostasia shenzhenica]
MTMNARLVGSGELTLVLAHGYGGSQAAWDAVVPDLSQRHQLLLFDWSFSGAIDPPPPFDSSMQYSFESLAGDLIAILDDMNLEGVVFVGHSISGMIGCIASIKRPELFTHLVLVAASPMYINTEDYHGGFDLSLVDSFIAAIESDFHGWAESFAGAVFATEHHIPMQKFLATLKAMNPKAALALAKTIFYSDQRRLLEHVEVPSTIIQGVADMAVPVAVAYYMLGKLKGGAAVHLVEENGHFPHVTSPKKFVEIINKTLMPNM